MCVSEQGARAVVLLGGGGGAVEALLGRYPRLPAARLLHLTLDAFLERYDALYRSGGCPPAPLLFCMRPASAAAGS